METHECLATWLNACCKLHHKVCTPTPIADRSPHQIPEWVIDTQNGCIVPGASVARYACLSYTWSQSLTSVMREGSGLGRLMLNNGNLADFQQPGFLNSAFADRVPPVFRDAMDLVLGAGERYLWIDCFCILQGDDSTRTEVDCMDDIYAGAHVTIIAAAAEGLRGGTTYGRLGKEWHYRYKELQHKLINTTWASRGWTFQENLLSKRTIVFIGDGETFWNCNTDVWHQDTTQREQERTAYLSYIDKHHAPGPSLSRLNWPDVELYTSIICLFNTRELSFPQDSQAAFSGVLHSFRRAFYGGFINALPRLFLDAALLWQPCKGQMVRRIPRAGSGMEPSYPQHLPTWSWCGWKCAIDSQSMALARDFEYPDYEDQHPWTLTHLVQWSVMSSRGERREDIREPVLWQKYKSYGPGTTEALPSGWRMKGSSVNSCDSVTQGRWFSHDALQSEDPEFAIFNEFAYPLPLPESDNNENQPCNTSWPFLTGCTTSANLRVRCILTPDRMTKDEKPFCVSNMMVSIPVTELPEFTAGPDDCFSVAVLEDGHGTWAGVLRVVGAYEAGKEQEILRPGEKVELIALSRGRVPCHIILDERIITELSEEQIDTRGWAKFDSPEEPNEGIYTQSHIRFRREGGLDKDDQAYKNGESVYEFYNSLIVNGETIEAYKYVRKTKNGNGPIQAVNSTDIICNNGGIDDDVMEATETFTVAAGDQVGFKMNEYIGHPGPLAVYLSKAPNTAKGYKGDGDWFKVYQSSLSNKTADPMEWASFVDGGVRNFTFTLPADLPAGEYLALHSAELYQAQFYMGCAQLKVTGSGASIPGPTVKFPGAYDPRDPGILYTSPGPKTWPVACDDSTVNVLNGQDSDGDCTPLEESAKGDPVSSASAAGATASASATQKHTSAPSAVPTSAVSTAPVAGATKVASTDPADSDACNAKRALRRKPRMRRQA